MKIFRGSIIVTIIALAIAYFYAGLNGLFITGILAVLEVSLSMDNAIVNARILEKMNHFWRGIFLTVGILVAVVGMRLIFPLLIVGISARINPIEALQLALAKGDPSQAGTYGYILHHSHPQIAAFGGMFLLMLSLEFFFDERAHSWLKIPEKLLKWIGYFPSANVIISIVALMIAAQGAHNPSAAIFAGILGILSFLLVNGLGHVMSQHQPGAGTGEAVLATGKAALSLFLYLEVIDASFSFDGVIGAFAITNDPIIILLGLGVIGAMFVRSLTLYLVAKGTLNELVYLEHGAHWAIMALAVFILVSIHVEIGEAVTGLTGAVLIGLSFLSSVLYNRKH
ncbi:DUF475 domain-containing protein [Lactococcus termiticola]|uniref:Integral membrane protein n=1 Tax=Lactococcus termiticola TaxID=2169526 RepID=A0A2R5HEF2_9LACT|nr:DUF475 domain-containing protein [Lactococcus termiticola]GBG96402.1 hypothetical protein NtB2_00514 [Lactococcus termiticola]